MTARVRQVPGWWANLVRAECDECGWHGPQRDLNERLSISALVGMEADQHRCGHADDSNLSDKREGGWW